MLWTNALWNQTNHWAYIEIELVDRIFWQQKQMYSFVLLAFECDWSLKSTVHAIRHFAIEIYIYVIVSHLASVIKPRKEKHTQSTWPSFFEYANNYYWLNCVMRELQMNKSLTTWIMNTIIITNGVILPLVGIF